MSLAHSHKDLHAEDASMRLRLRASAPAPRSLRLPDSRLQDGGSLRDAQSPAEPRPCSRPSGNAKPQEPASLGPRTRGMKTRTAGHIHPRPWTSSCQPGHKENATGANPYHRVWMTDGALAEKGGKWTAERTRQHFREQDKALFALKPHDEISTTGCNVKYWTHLVEGGTLPGGLDKLDLAPERGTGRHLKGGLYSGKFENIKHAQLILRTGFQHENEKRQDIHQDRRRMFDNRLKDDMVRANDEADRQAARDNFDLFRPSHTLSCPQLGADFVNR